MPKRIAIACQGGGAHTAFTAGALDRILAEDWPEPHDLVALSGTSGGAVCAALVWSGLVRKGPQEARARLAAFWDELEAADPLDAALNAWGLWAARLPVSFEVSPHAVPPLAEVTLARMLRDHLRLEELPPDRAARQRPFLRIGAADVIQGDATVFTGETLELMEVVASAAVPPLYRAIPLRGSVFWDGLYSQNPPVRELLRIDEAAARPAPKRKPEEIWVVRINPRARAAAPRTAEEIEDRRNEMAGNTALEQELRVIRKMNALRAKSAPLRKLYDEVTVRVVELDIPGDYASKYDRSPARLRALRERGRALAPLFLRPESLWPRQEP